MSKRLVRSPEAPKRTMRSIIEFRSSELAIKGEGGADQREVRKGLRKVAQLLAGRADLLGIETDMICVGEHLLEREPCVIEPSGARERLDPPERTHGEGSLLSAE